MSVIKVSLVQPWVLGTTFPRYMEPEVTLPDTDIARVGDVLVFGWPLSITLTTVGGAGGNHNWEDPNISRETHVTEFLQITYAPSCGQATTQENRMNTDFHKANEGGDHPTGYVPTSGGVPAGDSGVTIGYGVDLGARSMADLQRLNLSGPLRNILAPYLGLRGVDAQTYLAAHPLTLSDSARFSLNLRVWTEIYSNVSNNYNGSSVYDYWRLPGAVQTVIGDLALQYGPDLHIRTPDVWAHLVNGRWQDAVDELRDFGDIYPTRRNAEADILQAAIDNGEIPPSC